MNGSRQQKIEKVGRKWKTSSQSRQQHLPAQGTSAEGERLTVYDTRRGYDAVGKDARQFPNIVTDTGEKTGESLTEHIFTLVLRALLLVMQPNSDHELRDGLSAA